MQSISVIERSLLSKNLNLIIATSSISKSNFSTSTSNKKSEFNLASYARGTGGRSSFNGKCVTVFGANGTMGRILSNRLGRQGAHLVAAHRGCEWDLRQVKLGADLGQVTFQEIDVRCEDSLRKAVQHSDVVINCIGTDWETKNFKFDDVHVKAAQSIAKVCREFDVQKFIHFSALNASLTPQKFYFRPSEFLISKYKGEEAVRNEFPDAVIIRPSFMYGEGDKFLTYYTSFWRREGGRMPLWKKGEMTIKQPVSQSDVADGIMAILHNKDIRGTTYDFVGQEKYLLSDIIDYIYKLRRQDMKRTHMTPTKLAYTYFFEHFFKRSKFNFDILEREFISDELSTDSFNPTLADLKREQGSKFKNFEEMVRWHVAFYDTQAFHTEKLKEHQKALPPTPIDEDYEYQLRRKLALHY